METHGDSTPQIHRERVRDCSEDDMTEPNSENAGDMQARGRFRPGISGNPAGKKPGTRHRVTRLVEKLLDGEAKTLTRKAIDLALEGDVTALRLCLERIAPVRKGRTVALDLPNIEKPEDVLAAMSRVVAALGNGDVTTEEATAIAGVIEIHRRTVETADLDARLKRLETEAEKTP